MRRLFAAPLLLALCLLIPASASASESAIGGYDPVAYHLVGEAQKGSAAFAADWDSVRWHFASEENKQRFLANPEDYAPQYNGWCAYAAARNYIAAVDPVNGWSLYDGKLYLNWSASVKHLWRLRASNNISRADANWPGLKQKLDAGEISVNR